MKWEGDTHTNNYCEKLYCTAVPMPAWYLFACVCVSQMHVNYVTHKNSPFSSVEASVSYREERRSEGEKTLHQNCVFAFVFCFPPNENAFDDNNQIPRTAYLIVNDATMTKEIKWQKWREKQKNSQEKQQEDDDEKEKMEMKCSETLLV